MKLTAVVSKASSSAAVLCGQIVFGYILVQLVECVHMYNHTLSDLLLEEWFEQASDLVNERWAVDQVDLLDTGGQCSLKKKAEIFDKYISIHFL